MIHVLIVEDEKPISNLIRMSLTKEGFLCTCAYDGAAAAEPLPTRARKWSPGTWRAGDSGQKGAAGRG